MLLDLICYDCLKELIDKGVPNSNVGEPIMTPFEQVNNSGIYEVNCSKGHNSLTVIDNIDFEILFEYGLNAIVDGYYREAVSSLTASLERYYEFFIKTVLKATGIDFATIDKVWKHVSNQSERQIGAYIFLYFQTFGIEPSILNANKEVPFRNSVIHKGYIPKRNESIEYGNKIMELIESSLINLKNKYPEAVIETFTYYGYETVAKHKFDKIKSETGIEQDFACVNIMTTIDVIHGREINKDDGRHGNVEQRIESILKERIPKKLTLMKKEA